MRIKSHTGKSAMTDARSPASQTRLPALIDPISAAQVMRFGVTPSRASGGANGLSKF